MGKTQGETENRVYVHEKAKFSLKTDSRKVIGEGHISVRHDRTAREISNIGKRTLPN